MEARWDLWRSRTYHLILALSRSSKSKFVAYLLNYFVPLRLSRIACTIFFLAAMFACMSADEVGGMLKSPIQVEILSFINAKVDFIEPILPVHGAVEEVLFVVLPAKDDPTNTGQQIKA